MRIHEDVKDEYRAMRDFKEITGEGLRTYRQTKDGFVDAGGRKALDVVNLRIGFLNGELQDSAFNPAVMKGLDITI